MSTQHRRWRTVCHAASHVVKRALSVLVLLALTACGVTSQVDPSAGAKRTHSLPTSATADDVGVIDNVGVIESPDAVEVKTLTAPIVGRLYVPTDRPSKPVPAVLFLGGSEGYVSDLIHGGLSDSARHLAAQGFVTLHLCYFGCPERAQYLDRIPVEYVLSAITHLRGLPQVDASSVNVYGVSRGAELALLIGSYSQDIRSVISVFGSPWVFGGLVGLGLAGRSSGDCAWTVNGSCVPIGMLIPVQQIRGPVLLFHGQYDALWPLAYSEQISTKLDSAQHPHSLVVFPDVGQTFGTLDCLIGTGTCNASTAVCSCRLHGMPPPM